jgi:hypothetical protein
MSTDAPLDIAIRLAGEGIPIGAIARAVRIPSANLREELAAACGDGRLLALPKNDWPPGSACDQRALLLSRMLSFDREALVLAAKRSFTLTSTQADLLLRMLQAPIVRRDSASSNSLSVHVCGMRKLLAGFDIRICTLWGTGYTLADADRRRAMDLIIAAT